MGLQAVDSVERALDRVKDLLLPLDFWTWTRLALILIFLGGTGATDVLFNAPDLARMDLTGSDLGTGLATQAPELTSSAILLAGAGILSLILLFTYLGSVFEFVMFRSLRDGNVRVRKNFRDHMSDALKYFLFRVSLLAVMLASVIPVILLFTQSIALGLLAAIPLVAFLIATAVFSSVVHDFALQNMIEEGESFLKSVRVSFEVLAEDWREFAGYLLVRLLVSWGVGAISFIAIAVLTLIIGIPFIIAAVAAAVLSNALAVLVAVFGLLVWLVALMYAKVPFTTYMYCYFVELYDSFFEVAQG